MSGKLAVVCGGSSGIGAAISAELIRAGAAVALCGRSQDSVTRTVAELRAAGHQVLGVSADLRQSADVDFFMSQVISWQGHIDVLINAVGGSFSDSLKRGPIVSASAEDLIEAYRLNAVSAWACSTRALPHLRAQSSGGAIVNVASIAAFHPEDNLGAYGASKAALVSLTRTMAREWAPSVRVNAVVPGYIDTPRTRQQRSPARVEQLVDRTPLSRLGTPQDIAAATLFLCSQAASWITGAALPVDGGYTNLGAP